MGLDQPDRMCALISIPSSELLPKATARLQRQKQYARVLERGGNRASGLESWLSQAAECITALAQPTIALKPVKVSSLGAGVHIADRVQVDDPNLAADISSGGAVTAYLITLGFSQKAAFDWLDGDYGAHHVLSDLSNEVLFELGRTAHRIQREQRPEARLKRISILVSEICGQGKIWDPQKVQTLLGVFDDAGLDVSVTDTGCFQPLNTLLGLTVARAP